MKTMSSGILVRPVVGGKKDDPIFMDFYVNNWR